MPRITYAVDGEALKRYRTARGVTHEHLRDKTGLSLRTLSRMECAHCRHDASSLQRVAGALDVPLRALVKIDGIPEHLSEALQERLSPSTHPAPGQQRVTIPIARDPSKMQVDEVHALLALISREFNQGREVVLVNVEKGSLVLTVDLPAEVAERLHQFATEKEGLLQYGVLQIARGALGRSAIVACPSIWDWIKGKLRNLGVETQDLDIRTAPTEFEWTDRQTQDFIGTICRSYRVARFGSPLEQLERRVRAIYNLRLDFGWEMVPLGDLVDFVHENHGLQKEDEPDC